MENDSNFYSYLYLSSSWRDHQLADSTMWKSGTGACQARHYWENIADLIDQERSRRQEANCLYYSALIDPYLIPGFLPITGEVIFLHTILRRLEPVYNIISADPFSRSLAPDVLLLPDPDVA